MSSYEEVRIMIKREHLNGTKLAQMLSEKTGKRYTQNSLQQKITKSSLNYDEMEIIAELLGYEIVIMKKQN